MPILHSWTEAELREIEACIARAASPSSVEPRREGTAAAQEGSDSK